jgi:hypothetical protein
MLFGIPSFEGGETTVNPIGRVIAGIAKDAVAANDTVNVSCFVGKCMP